MVCHLCVYGGGPAQLDIEFPQANIFLLDPDEDQNLFVIESNEDDGALRSRVVENLTAGEQFIVVVVPRDFEEGAPTNQYRLSVTGPGGVSEPPEPDDQFISISVNDDPIEASFEEADEQDWYSFIPSATGVHMVELLPDPATHKPGLPLKWNVPEVSFQMDQGPLGDLDESTIQQMVRDAVAVWNGVSSANIELQEGEPLPADIVVADATRLTLGGHTLFYDQQRDALLSFGGFDFNFALDGGTREWDGSSWVELELETAPSPRAYPATAYDTFNQRLILFGGFGTGEDGTLAALGDTWVWDGEAWTEMSPAVSPPARFFSDMSFDQFFGEALLFGGRDDGALLNDTWIWDGENWIDFSNPLFNPPGRFGHQVFYDPVSELTYAIHGSTGGGNFFDMWVWRGTTWSNITDEVTTPSARAFGQIAFDEGLERIVLFGGDGGNAGLLNDTWIWNGTDWVEARTETAPPPRFEFGMAYDAGQQSLFVSGGRQDNSVLNDNWLWNGETWTQLGPLDSLENELNGFADQGINPIVFDNQGNLTELLLGEGMREIASSFTEIVRSEDDEILAARMVLNGWFLSEAAGENQLSIKDFTNELVHEFGHFLGLTNTQFNTYKQRNNDPVDDTPTSVMYPFRLELTGDELFIHHDDIVAISELYPSSDGALESDFGTISGKAVFEEGQPVLGGMVIARKVDDLDNILLSRMTDQNAQLDGAFTLPGLPEGDYLVSIEPVDLSHFDEADVGFHSVDPNGAAFTAPPAPEYYNGDNETGDPEIDNHSKLSLVRVQPGQVSEVNFVCSTLISGRLLRSQLLPFDVDFTSGISEEERNDRFYPYSVVIDDTQTAMTVEWNSTGNLPLGIRVERAGQTVFSNQTSPEARRNFGMAYDAARRRTVLYGGWVDTGPENDTWEWDGTSWQLRPVDLSPVPRLVHSLAYDEARERVIMFGGTDTATGGGGVNFGDTWEWNGSEWDPIPTPDFPSPRVGYSLSYDADLGKTFLFSGIDSTFTWVGDTWEYDGSAWSQIETSNRPSARNAYSMVYDQARGFTLLFGGSDANGTINGESWMFDGMNWTELSPANAPSPRRFHDMVYDTERDVMVLFGGVDEGTDHMDDTWEWDGETWTEINTPNSPAPRSRHRMAYDSNRGRVVLYSGFSEVDGEETRLSDTWEYDGSDWVNVTPPVQTENAFTLTRANGLESGTYFLWVYNPAETNGSYTIKVTASEDDDVSVNQWNLH